MKVKVDLCHPLIVEALERGALLKWKMLPCISKLLSAEFQYLTGTFGKGFQAVVKFRKVYLCVLGQHPDITGSLASKAVEGEMSILV